MSDLQQTPVAPVTPETEKFPEVEIRNWPQAKMVFALGYWLTRVIKRSDTGKSRAKFIFYFRMNKAELVEIIKAYYSAEGLKVDCRDYDVGERPRPLSKARDEVRRVARRARLRSSL